MNALPSPHQAPSNLRLRVTSGSCVRVDVGRRQRIGDVDPADPQRRAGHRVGREVGDERAPVGAPHRLQHAAGAQRAVARAAGWFGRQR